MYSTLLLLAIEVATWLCSNNISKYVRVSRYTYLRLVEKCATIDEWVAGPKII